jgi:hypothetical protein
VTVPRLTVRLRLTLLYTGLFVVCGAILIAIAYGLVASLPEADLSARTAQCEVQDEQLRNECKEAFREGLTSGAQGQREATLAHLLRYSLITLAAATLLAALAGWIAAGRVLRPVHQITQAARAASEHDLSARGSRSVARVTSCASWPTRSIPCWAGSRRRSRASGGSSPTPAMSCAPR